MDRTLDESQQDRFIDLVTLEYLKYIEDIHASFSRLCVEDNLTFCVEHPMFAVEPQLYPWLELAFYTEESGYEPCYYGPQLLFGWLFMFLCDENHFYSIEIGGLEATSSFFIRFPFLHLQKFGERLSGFTEIEVDVINRFIQCGQFFIPNKGLDFSFFPYPKHGSLTFVQLHQNYKKRLKESSAILQTEG